jgi:HK97 family phage prohead protease
MPAKNSPESRAMFAREVRVEGGAEGQPPKIVGYAAVFDSYSEDLGGFREIIRPGAFAAALAASPDVRALIDHNPSLVLARTKSGTLTIVEDAKGLRFELTPPDTTAARDLMASMKRGDISGASFAFDVRDFGDSWGKDEKGKWVRELKSVNLYDVSVVTYPAYPATETALRSLQNHEAKAAPPAAAVDTGTRRRRLQLLEKEG